MKKQKTKNAAVLFSGGKDSCLALFKAKNQGCSIKYLLSVIPRSHDSYMYHKPNIILLKKQAEMLGIPLIIKKSSAKKEEELKDLIKLINKVKKEVEYLIIGGIASNYQAERIKKIVEGTKLKVISPLWRYSPEELWRELLKNNFKVIIIKIACEGLPKEMLGKVIDEKMLLRLKSLSQKYKFSLDFEGGDAETAVLYCPLFKKKIKIRFKEKSEGKYRHFIVIEKVFS